MEYRQLGKSGPQVPVLGLGAWPIGGGMGRVDEQTALSTIHTAIDNGLTLIDTAQGYLSSEAIIGKALKSDKRDRCFLATKVTGNYSRQDIVSAMENSLRALAVDYVDLYQIHHWNPQYPLEESMAAMAQLQAEGKTRFIGVSNFNAAQLEQAGRIAPIQSNQPVYNLFDRQIEAEDIRYCEREGIGILAHSALAKGLLAGKYRPDHTFSTDHDERAGFPRFQNPTFARYLAVADRLAEAAQDKGLSLIEFAIAWILQSPAVTCVLVGARNPDQVKQQLGAVGVTFSDDELARIDEILADAPDV
jgi:aryl-alcohol dehydrogenase-like predicted oxidoreductase